MKTLKRSNKYLFRNPDSYLTFYRKYKGNIVHVRIVPAKLGGENFGTIEVITKEKGLAFAE